MNYIQFILFLIFVFSSLAAGSLVYVFLKTGQDKIFLNRSLLMGELFLLGSSFLIGLMTLCAMFHLYNAWILWGLTGASYLFLLNRRARELFVKVFTAKPNIDLWKAGFILLICVFVFRNIFFMVDVDGMTNYLYSQKLWLAREGWLQIFRSDNYSAFLPQFDAVPYALGLSLFPHETLFPQLISIYWRVIAAILLFGYTGYRLNSLYGLAAAALFLFNDHIFYSGANHYVIINSALVALLTAVSYNLWESRKENGDFRLLLAFIFCTQIPANKYQMMFVLPFLAILFVIVPRHFFQSLKSFILWPAQRLILLISAAFSALCFFRNYIITGNPVFPGFAGQFESFGWTMQQQEAFKVLFSGVSFSEFIKFTTFFYIWPGIKATKLLCFFFLFIPLVFLWSFKLKKELDVEKVIEISFWLILSFFMLFAISLASHTDPRYYRYGIGIFCLAAVISYSHIISLCSPFRNQLLFGLLFLAVSFSGVRIVQSEAGPFQRPTFKQNIQVLLNRLHTEEVLLQQYPEIQKVRDLIKREPGKFEKSAFHVSGTSNFPLFSFPIRPIVGLYRTTVIGWDSFETKERIVHDLKEYDIKWIIEPDGKKYIFRDIEDFSGSIRNINRKPKEIYSNYNLPKELL